MTKLTMTLTVSFGRPTSAHSSRETLPDEAHNLPFYNLPCCHSLTLPFLVPRDHSHDLPHCNPYDFIAASQPTSRSPQRTPQRTPQHSPHALFNSPSPRTYNPQSETPPPLTVAAFTKLAASHPFPTMTPPPPTCIDDLTTQILAEIRTAGLRKGRENALIQLLTELKQETRAHVEGCGRAVREYAVFAEGVVSARNLAGRKWEALEGVVNGLKGKESKMAELARQQAGRAEEEIEELKQQVKLMEVAHTTEKEQMDVQVSPHHTHTSERASERTEPSVLSSAFEPPLSPLLSHRRERVLEVAVRAVLVVPLVHTAGFVHTVCFAPSFSPR